VGNCKKLPNNG